ncbi:methionine ABC transporter permease [Nevskia soli]|uniref:methionine ABC transporter permease n=1 Tax=Nevskia soli TaxID=418856 RepID=UPI0004A6C3FB
MSDSLIEILPDLWLALGQTALMLLVSLAASVLLGGPLGVLVLLTDRGQLLQRPWLFAVLNGFINVVRSFPFVILIVALVPLTRWLIGSSIGPLAAAVPLSFAAVPYFARLVEQSLREVPRGVVEAAEAMGASVPQIVFKVLLVEARSGLVLGLTVMAVSLLSYTAVAGVVGGGGIGDLAIRYGYYRFQTNVMLITVAILVVIVQAIQFTGNRIAARLDKR